MHIAMACSSKDLEYRHPHRAEAVNEQSGDDPQTMPSVTQSQDDHLEHLRIADI